MGCDPGRGAEVGPGMLEATGTWLERARGRLQEVSVVRGGGSRREAFGGWWAGDMI